ncbi:MAG TPA: hypothetical protein PK280_03925 [Planctomycetota bacterium]|nr:hypothetical protein [Planctomycetota bacterium]
MDETESAPEQPTETPAPPVAQAVPAQREYPCAQCGAKVRFDPGAASLKCPYCGAEAAIPQSAEDVAELDFSAALTALAGAEDTCQAPDSACSSCGARVALPPGDASGACPFCSSPVVVAGGSARRIKPRSLLPFKVTREQAWAGFRKWITGLWFAPNELKRYAREEEKLSGVYVPYWTYDSRTTSWYTGERGEDYWATESYTTTVNGKSVRRTRQVRRTRWYPASGVVWNKFDDVLVLASKSLPRERAEELEPWDLENLAPFKEDYLSGFRAESYGVDLAEGFEAAKGIMDEGIRASIRRDIGGDHQRIHSVKTRYEGITFKHLLLPVWVSAYRYRDKVYRILVNARTGEVQGERPWSWVKITLLALGIAGGIAAVISVLASSTR